MRNKAYRIILDTNLWISFLITHNLSVIDKFLNDGRIKLIFSEELLQEFIEVAKRPKFKKYFNTNDITELLDYFDIYGELVKVTKSVKLCRDPNDDFLLSLALEGKADYLIT